jgi:hypothetical protein
LLGNLASDLCRLPKDLPRLQQVIDGHASDLIRPLIDLTEGMDGAAARSYHRGD